MVWTTIVIEALVIFALIILNGALALSEMAIVSARKTRLQQLADEGHYGAKIALDLANTPSTFLASIQIGITLVGVLAGAFGGATVAKELSNHLKDAPFVGQYNEAIGLGSVVIVVTLLSLILGELIPKRIALANAESFAVRVSRPIKIISLLASPLVKTLSAITEIALKILQIKPNEDPGVSEEEVKILIKQGAEAGVFEPQEETLMNRVLAFGDRKVGEIMTQRRQLVSLNVAASFDINLKEILKTPHSYYPVYKGSSDHLIGIISVKDLLESLATRKPSDIDLKEFLREPVFVTESMSTLKLLEKLKQTGTHMALVVDEYGGTAGIVTIVDIIETIVGDMPAVHDGTEARVTKRDDGSLLVDGSLSIFDLSELLSESVSEGDLKGDYSTVAGLVISQLGHIPKEGEKITWHNHVFEIIDMDGHRVDKVLIYTAPNS